MPSVIRESQLHDQLHPLAFPSGVSAQSIGPVNLIGQEHLSQSGLDSLYSRWVNLKDWVKAARTHKGLTQEQLGNELGLTKGNISGWENGRHEPGYAQLLKIELITGYKLHRELDPGADFQVLEPSESRPAYGMQPILAWEHEDDLPAGEFVMIPRLDVHLSAGGGKEQVEIEFSDVQPQAFRADWIRKKRFKPKKLASMTADGDSMEERIHDGDALVVDTSQTTVVDGKVYALWYEGGERVKRLYRLPGGGLRIVSDNPKYQPIELTADTVEHVRIIGRIVHVAGEGGL